MKRSQLKSRQSIAASAARSSSVYPREEGRDVEGHALAPQAVSSATHSSARPEWADLYETYRIAVWRCLLQRGIPREQALDLTHRVFEVAFKSWDNFRAESDRGAWLLGIARWTALGHHRKDARSGLVLETPEFVDATEQSAWTAALPHGERALLSNELIESVELAVAELSPLQRQVFVLVVVKGFQCAEAGRLLEIEQRAAYTHLEAARRSVRQHLRRLL